MNREIGVYLIPITSSYEKLLTFKEDVEGMDIVIQEYIESKLPKDIEVFKVDGNIIIAEDGYRLVYFLD